MTCTAPCLPGAPLASLLAQPFSSAPSVSLEPHWVQETCILQLPSLVGCPHGPPRALLPSCHRLWGRTPLHSGTGVQPDALSVPAPSLHVPAVLSLPPELEVHFGSSHQAWVHHRNQGSLSSCIFLLLPIKAVMWRRVDSCTRVLPGWGALPASPWPAAPSCTDTPASPP